MNLPRFSWKEKTNGMSYKTKSAGGPLESGQSLFEIRLRVRDSCIVISFDNALMPFLSHLTKGIILAGIQDIYRNISLVKDDRAFLISTEVNQLQEEEDTQIHKHTDKERKKKTKRVHLLDINTCLLVCAVGRGSMPLSLLYYLKLKHESPLHSSCSAVHKPRSLFIIVSLTIH